MNEEINKILESEKQLLGLCLKRFVLFGIWALVFIALFTEVWFTSKSQFWLGWDSAFILMYTGFSIANLVEYIKQRKYVKTTAKLADKLNETVDNKEEWTLEEIMRREG